MKPQDTSPSPTDKFWIKKYTRRVNGEQKYFVALEDFDGLAKQNEHLRAEKERLRAALNVIPPYRLRALASYLDDFDKAVGETGREVQDDLLRMADLSDAALGVDSK